MAIPTRAHSTALPVQVRHLGNGIDVDEARRRRNRRTALAPVPEMSSAMIATSSRGLP